MVLGRESKLWRSLVQLLDLENPPEDNDNDLIKPMEQLHPKR